MYQNIFSAVQVSMKSAGNGSKHYSWQVRQSATGRLQIKPSGLGDENGAIGVH